MTPEEREDVCAAKRTVQVGPLAAIDLQCVLERWSHIEGIHFSARSFGDVHMTARWPGEFEEER